MIEIVLLGSLYKVGLITCISLLSSQDLSGVSSEGLDRRYSVSS